MNPRVTEAETRFMPPLGASGFVLMHASRRYAAATGTTVTVGNETNPADLSDPAGAPQNSVPYQAFYAMGLVIAEIAPGTQLWTLDISPAQLREGEKWVIRSHGGQRRLLVVERASGNQMQIRQVDQDNPFSAPAQLDVLRLDTGFALRSILFERQSHTLRISFEPTLPLTALGSEDRTDVDFSVSEDDQASIAHGKVSVQRAYETEHILWQFNAPNWAKANTFDTGVNVVR